MPHKKAMKGERERASHATILESERRRSVMSKKGAQLLDEALSLPPAERAELADRLLTSLDSSPDHRIDELWSQEAESRLDAFERGEIKAVSAKEAFDSTRDTKS